MAQAARARDRHRAGHGLGRSGEPSPASPAAWAAAGAVIRRLHEAPLPPWTGPTIDDYAEDLDRGCEGYSHITPAMRHQFLAHLTRLREAALDARRAMASHSPVVVLDRLLEDRRKEAGE